MPLTTQSATAKDKRTAPGATLEPRHFAFIASTIAKTRDPFAKGVTARLFADACQSTNPRFDRARFLRACGVGE